MASLAILLTSVGVPHKYKILRPKVRVMAIKAVAIRAMVEVMVILIGRPMAKPMPLMLVSTRGILLVSLKGINQDHLFILSIGLTRLFQKTEFKN